MNLRLLLLTFIPSVSAWCHETLTDTLQTDSLHGYRLQEVVKIGRYKEDKLRSAQMGMTVMDYRSLKSVPTMFGEADVVKALQLQPGVSAGTEGFAGMFVRGGENDENMFLIDGSPVYQMNHLGGLFSAYNAEAISHLSFYKGAFPARYGGRLSSVTDISIKTGSYEKWQGNFTVGLTSANFSLSGPIVKDKTSLFAAVRRSWLELISLPALAIMNASKKKDGEKTIAGYNFTDFNLKISQRLGRMGTLSLLGYYGYDKVKMGEHRFSNEENADGNDYYHKNENRLGWGNMLGAVKWHYPINALIAYDMKASYTRYQSTFKRTVETVSDEAEEGKDALSRSYSDTRNAINDLSVNAAFSFTPSDQAVFRLGAQYTHHQFSPAENANQSTSLPTERETNPKVIANEWNCYVEGDIQAAPWLQFNAGLRGSFFRVEGKQYPVFEPRISANFRVSPTVSLKAGYAKMSQFVQQVSDNYISLPTDYWLPITRHFAPLTSHQVSAGIYVSPNKRYTFSLEGYYKKMSNLLEYKDNYKYMQTDSWEQTLCSGNGRAYGMDFQAEAEFGNIQGFIGYGLMWSDRLFPELNGGKRFPSKYDNRHKVTLSATWCLSPRIELNAGWVFMTGNRATLSLENYAYPDGYPTDIVPTYPNKEEEMPNFYEGKNNVRLPAYHRLDLGINFYRPLKRGRMRIWNISLYNAYSRMNPIMIEKNNQKQTTDGQSLAPHFRQFALFPLIPSVSYTYKF